MKPITLILITLLIINTSCKKEEEDTTILPTLSTVEITEITPTSATSGGDIIDDGGGDITDKGVCWSTTPEPTVFDFITNEGVNPSDYLSYITNLTINTTYYVRAYATNSKGTAYGNELSFVAKYQFTGETVSLASGSFHMGSDEGSASNKPIHLVNLDAFSIGKYEVTNEQYANFMNEIDADSNGIVGGFLYIDMLDEDKEIEYLDGEFIAKTGKKDNPVVATWYGAKYFCEHYGGRLPTEAEWEFAARGGSESNNYTYSGSNNPDNVAWYSDNADGTTHTVGVKNSNEIELYDMSGNVGEWCSDWYDADYYTSSPQNNPQGPVDGEFKVFRGGSWVLGSYNATVYHRMLNDANLPKMGFRPVFTP